MEYIKTRIPEAEIRLAFELFTKEDAIKRVLIYIESLDSLAEHQFNLLKRCYELNDNYENYCSNKKL